MPRHAHQPAAAGTIPPAPGEATVADLEVRGSLPDALSGRFLTIGPGPTGSGAQPDQAAASPSMVHAVTVQAGRATSYCSRWVETDPAGREPVGGPRRAARDEAHPNLIEFAGRTLALAEGALAHELAPDLGTLERVDLAGRARGVGARPKTDPVSGELHLISSPRAEASLLHVISPGGKTRHTWPIEPAPAAVYDLAVTATHIVLMADGFVGRAPRTETEPVRWQSVDTTATARVISAHDDGDAVVLHVTSPALERWTLSPDQPVARRAVIDARPQTSARINEARACRPHRYLYSVIDHEGRGDQRPVDPMVTKHDLNTGARSEHRFANDHRLGGLLFVADRQRDHLEDGGWLLGLVHDDRADATSLVVLDAVHPDAPRLATVRLPHRLACRDLHGLWSPTPS